MKNFFSDYLIIMIQLRHPEIWISRANLLFIGWKQRGTNLMKKFSKKGGPKLGRILSVSALKWTRSIHVVFDQMISELCGRMKKFDISIHISIHS